MPPFRTQCARRLQYISLEIALSQLGMVQWRSICRFHGGTSGDVDSWRPGGLSRMPRGLSALLRDALSETVISLSPNTLLLCSGRRLCRVLLWLLLVKYLISQHLLFVNNANRLPSKPPPSRHALMETMSNPHPTATYAFGDAFLTLWLRTIAVDPALGALVAAYIIPIVSLYLAICISTNLSS